MFELIQMKEEGGWSQLLLTFLSRVIVQWMWRGKKRKWKKKRQKKKAWILNSKLKLSLSLMCGPSNVVRCQKVCVWFFALSKKNTFWRNAGKYTPKLMRNFALKLWVSYWDNMAHLLTVAGPLLDYCPWILAWLSFCTENKVAVYLFWIVGVCSDLYCCLSKTWPF